MPSAAPPIDETLNDTFAALANPTRRAILAHLANGEASVNDIAAPFDMSLPAISRHIKVLERAGLIVRGQQAQYRPCTLDARPLEAVAAWTERYRPIWEDRFDRLDDYVRRLHDAQQRDQSTTNTTINEKKEPTTNE